MSVNRNSFTLIELVVAIVVVGILLASYVMLAMPDDSIKLSTAGKKVAADIEYARSRALALNKWHGIEFTGTTTYRIYVIDGITDTTIEDPLSADKLYEVDIEELFSGVTITTSNLGSANKMEFDPFGVPYADKNDTNPLLEDVVIILQSKTKTHEVAVAQVTGMVEER